MSWASASDFFHMGGYALYVWGSYLVTAGLVAMELAALRLRRRAALARLAGERR
jgi:heme exporter protein D